MAVKVKKSTGTENLVVNQLVIKPANRTTSDISTWRNALQSADKGKVKQLYDLFDDLLIDGILADAIDKRKTAVANAALTFQNANGEEVPEMALLIDSTAFEDLLNAIIDVRFWGRTGVEMAFSAENQATFEQIPFKHIKLENKTILINDSDESGISYEGDDHLLILGRPRQFGLLLKAAPYIIWKRGGFGDYAQWLELFGMPQRVGKYSSADPTSRELLMKALEEAGSAAWCVVPKETEIEQSNLIGNSTGTAHKDFIEQCNTEVLITILGQTMTTMDGSSKSQSETHKAVEDGKHRADMRYVRRVLNWIVLPMLEKRGFPVAGGKFVFPEDVEPLTVEEVVKLSSIIEIPVSFVRNKYGIPEPKDGEPIARTNSNTQIPNTKRGATENPDDPDTELIKNADKSFWKGLFDFFVTAPGSGALNTQTHTNSADAIPLLGGARGGLNLADGNINAQIITDVGNGHTGFHPALFEYISADLIKSLDVRTVQLADLGFQYGYQNDAFRTAQELNVFHFSAGKTLAEITKLNEAYRNSANYAEFEKKAGEITNTFNKVYQKTEYESAALISESTANYNRLSSKTNLFPYWKYLTVRDDRTRPEHAKLHGLILAASDPRWKKIWPPNGWKCRCYVVGVMAHEVKDVDIKANQQLFDEYIDSTDFKLATGSGFGVNRALSPEVFAANQQYIKNFPNQANKLLNDVNYHTYGLKGYEANRAAATSAVTTYDGNLESYVSVLKKEDGKTFFTDYAGRSILFDLKSYLKGHSTKVVSERAKYIAAANEALKTPDEVWVNAVQDTFKTGDFSQYVFLKYYSDEVIAVIASVEKNGIYQVKTWFPVNEVTKTLDKAKQKLWKYKYRSGLLIKKPS